MLYFEQFSQIKTKKIKTSNKFFYSISIYGLDFHLIQLKPIFQCYFRLKPIFLIDINHMMSTRHHVLSNEIESE